MGKSLSLSVFFISLSLFAENQVASLDQANAPKIPANPSYDHSAREGLDKCQGPQFFAQFFGQMSQHPDCTPEDRVKWRLLANKAHEQAPRMRQQNGQEE